MASHSESLVIAVTHHEAGRLQVAEQIYRQILAIDPNEFNALHLLGGVIFQRGQYETAIQFFKRAIDLKGDEAAFHNSLGMALKHLGRLDEAARCYQRALELKPGYAEVHFNLGRLLKEQGKLDEAVASYERAVDLKPGYVEALNNLGTSFHGLGRFDEAISSYRRALNLNSDSAETHNNLGGALKALGQLDQAIAAYRKAVELKPDFTTAFSNLLYALYFSEDYDSAAIYEEHRRLDSSVCVRQLSSSAKPHANNRNPNRRLRIGYVSPDFRNHCQSLFTAPLLAAHDHGQFEIFCYADVSCPDGMTHRLQSYADVWRNINGFSDQRAADLIRQDQIDILVDLTMHMANGRPLLFARKPAPVQVAWLAYPGTTGLSSVDYRITDPYLDPSELSVGCYSERSVRLPDSFWCYEPYSGTPEVNDLPALENGFVTFGSFNNFCKVNDSTLTLWSNVLNAVSGSRLSLLAPEGSCRQHTLNALKSEGISSDRVTFYGKQPLQQYMELYHGLDIGLDTIPYNGHTTSLDSYWMGVPVVTLVGQTIVGRAGFSQLSNLGLTELVAQTPDRFVEIATKLTNDLPRLAELRATLRERMRRSPLMDAPQFARNIESAFRMMWRYWGASD